MSIAKSWQRYAFDAVKAKPQTVYLIGKKAVFTFGGVTISGIAVEEVESAPDVDYEEVHYGGGRVEFVPIPRWPRHRT